LAGSIAGAGATGSTAVRTLGSGLGGAIGRSFCGSAFDANCACADDAVGGSLAAVLGDAAGSVASDTTITDGDAGGDDPVIAGMSMAMSAA
jgi:hypothetical protein